MAHVFGDGQDQAYRDWRSANESTGFVLNARKNPGPDYLKAHRANCYHISNFIRDGKSWTKSYIKVCADSLEEIDAWTKKNFNVPSEKTCYCLNLSR